MERRQAAADPQPRPNDPGCESACRLPEATPTIAIYYYYSTWKMILIYYPTEGRRLSWPRCARLYSTPTTHAIILKSKSISERSSFQCKLTLKICELITGAGDWQTEHINWATNEIIWATDVWATNLQGERWPGDTFRQLGDSLY